MKLNNELGIGMAIFVDLMRTEKMFEGDKKKFHKAHLKDYYMAMIKEEPVYRISIDKNARVTTDCFDLIENFDPELAGAYDSVQDLPQWVQDKLAVLMVLDPTQINEEVVGIGRRISRGIFWVFKGTGIESGVGHGANT